MNIFRSGYKHICKARAFPWGVSRVPDNGNETRRLASDARTLGQTGPGERREGRRTEISFEFQ